MEHIRVYGINFILTPVLLFYFIVQLSYMGQQLVLKAIFCSINFYRGNVYHHFFFKHGLKYKP